MRTITVALGISLLCVVAPTSSKAKTDHAKCEDRCRAYYCPDSVRRELYCHYQCHKMCGAEGGGSNRAPPDKDHVEHSGPAIACEARQFDHWRLLNFL